MTMVEGRERSPSPLAPRQRARRSERVQQRRASRRKRWLIAAGIALGLAVLGTGAWYLAWRTDLLAIKQVEVLGVEGKLRQAVGESANVPMGLPLVELQTAALESRIESIEWVRDATVRPSWPRAVLITVEQRQALGQDWETGLAIDVDGTLFTPADGPPRGLPVVRASDIGRTEALRALEQVPADLVSRITMVSAVTRDDIRFTLQTGAVVRWGSAEQGALKAEVLTALLKRRALVYDVSSPLMPTTRGERTAAR